MGEAGGVFLGILGNRMQGVLLHAVGVRGFAPLANEMLCGGELLALAAILNFHMMHITMPFFASFTKRICFGAGYFNMPVPEIAFFPVRLA